jgi:hypothetical protein
MKNILYFTLLIFFLGACKKYPDDKKTIHFRTVLSRLCQDWKLKRVVSLSTGAALSFPGEDELTFYGDGEIQGGSPTIMDIPMYSQALILGGWNLSDNRKKNIVLTEISGGEQHWFTIHQLDPEELKFRNDTAEFYFVRK